jgi:putative FmdB family regulatory protein
MPRYDFRCPTCDETFEVSRPMAESDAPVTCSRGHEGAKRQLAVFAATGVASAPVASGGCCGVGCCS